MPTVVLDGQHDTVLVPRPREKHEPHFPDLVAYRCVDAGHNIPYEKPADFARAITQLHSHLTDQRLDR